MRKKVEPESLVKNPLQAKVSEYAVIGLCVSLGSDTCHALLAELGEREFYYEDCQRAISAIRHLCDEGGTINTVSLDHRAGFSPGTSARFHEHVGGLTFKDLPALIADIRRASGLRRLKQITDSVQGDILGGRSTPEQVIQLIERSLYGTDLSSIGDAEEAGEVARRVIADFMKRVESGKPAGLSTGLADLDRAIIGLIGGKNYVVGARPGVGKTAFANTLTESVLTQDHGVLTFSLEMLADELLERYIAGKSDVNARKISSGRDVTPDEMSRLVSAPDKLQTGRWFIDTKTYSIDGMRRRAKMVSSRLQRSGTKLGLVVIDYIQLAANGGDSREQSIGDVSRGCKMMAKELNVPVLALSQLNRNCEARENKRPQLADLRESGTIEQDADAVMFLYRDSLYNKDSSPEDAELIIAKQRNGPCGNIPLEFQDTLVRFSDRRNW